MPVHTPSPTATTVALVATCIVAVCIVSGALTIVLSLRRDPGRCFLFRPLSKKGFQGSQGYIRFRFNESTELESLELDSPELGSSELDGSKLGSSELDGSVLMIYPGTDDAAVGKKLRGSEAFKSQVAAKLNLDTLEEEGSYQERAVPMTPLSSSAGGADRYCDSSVHSELTWVPSSQGGAQHIAMFYSRDQGQNTPEKVPSYVQTPKPSAFMLKIGGHTQYAPKK